jgi:aminotransferase
LRKTALRLPGRFESKVTQKTKAILLPYPTNPTGGIMDKESLEKIAVTIKKHDLLVISDEIYSELTYGSRHTSIASLEGMKERCIVINGFSKAFAMTGWRLGYFAAPEKIAAAMLKLHQYVIMCAPTNSQYAALEALTRGLRMVLQA